MPSRIRPLERGRPREFVMANQLFDGGCCWKGRTQYPRERPVPVLIPPIGPAPEQGLPKSETQKEIHEEEI